jgi:outer membrane beta-barrel protein
MGRKTIARFMLTASLISTSFAANAQRANTQQAQPQPSGGSGADMDFSQPEQPAQGTGGDATSAGTAGATGAATDGTGASLQLDVPGGEVQPTRHPFQEDIYAVQRIYALRNRRMELSLNANFAVNDPFVSHTGFGLTANYWISNVLAVGLTGVFFQGLNSPSDVNFLVGRSANLIVPINEYQFAAAVNFSYVPLYGKFSMFSRFIFHWDLYLTAGVGVMRSRPIAAIDPEIRAFDWNTAILFDAGVGVRVFLSRWVGITLELRNFIYPELLENTTVAREGSDPTRCTNCRRDRNTWTGESALTDNVMLSVGLTFFLPTSVTYRLPK